MTRRPPPIVPHGTKGIYDADARIRARTARAMVRLRQTVLMTCAWPECVDPETGQPRQFLSRLRKGLPERHACSPTHRMQLWRQEMRDKGYRQITRKGLTGWLTPEGTFYPYPSSLMHQEERRKKRRQEQEQRREERRMLQQTPLQPVPSPRYRRLADSPHTLRFRARRARLVCCTEEV